MWTPACIDDVYDANKMSTYYTPNIIFETYISFM